MGDRRTILPDARVTPRFAGVRTFARLPRLTDVQPEHLPLDWVVYGVPFDGGVTFAPGARFAPQAIRDISSYVIKPYHVEHDVDIAKVMSLADGGDAPVRPYSHKENLDAIASFATSLGAPAHTRLLALGGDHSIAYANIKATWEKHGRPRGGLALVHFDSHLDTVDTVWGEKWGHASPFIRAIEDGLIDSRRMISVGIKGPMNAASDLDFARTHGIRILTYARWRAEGADMLDRFVTERGSEPTYVTFDVDCVDPAFAPGTGTPIAGGFSASEAVELLRSLKHVNIIGADVVEVLPDRDPSRITSLLAAQIAFELLAADAWRRSTLQV